MSKVMEIKRKHQRAAIDDMEAMLNMVMEHQEERVQARRREEAAVRKINKNLERCGLPVRLL